MNDRIREADAYPTDSYDWDYAQDGPRSKVLWGRVVILAVVLLLAFFLGRSTAGGGGVSEEDFNRLRASYDAAQDEIAALEEENDQLQENTNPGNADPTPGADATGDANTDPVNEDSSAYVVGEDDTLVGIANECYGDPSLDTEIMAANEITDPTGISIGQELIIPPNPTTGEAPTC